MKNPEERVKQLRSELEEHRYRYHVLDDPSISDGAYDSLLQELAMLEEQHPQLRDVNSPTNRVGGEPLQQFQQLEHTQPMLSLNDVFSLAELRQWYQRVEKLSQQTPQLMLDIKMDGVAAAVIYEAGELSVGVTRGDGYVGEDITHNIRTIDSVPLQLRDTDSTAISNRIEVRGEIIIYRADFERINHERQQQGLPLYANPRNLAAGSVRQLDPKVARQRPLRFHAYRVLTDPPQPTLASEYQLAQRLGFIINQMAQVVDGLKAAEELIQSWEAIHHTLPYNSDGVVVAVDDRSLYMSLGVVGQAPRGAVAYKYPAEQATTTVKDIQINVGRTGAVTPFAVLEPVRIGGTTVQMATLHNEDEIARKDVRIGDTVILQKAGDIIPEVVQVLPNLRSGHEQYFTIPRMCPECNAQLIRPEDEAIWRCPNPSCPARTHRLIEHFVSKAAFDIEGLGERVVKQLLEAELIFDAADLFSLRPEDIQELEGFGSKSANKLVDAIQASKTVPLERFLFGLGIRHIGQQTARDLASHFGSLDAIASATAEELQAVEGVGQVAAASIVAWFEDEHNRQLLQKLQQAGVTWQPPQTTTSELDGVTFVITGTLSSMSREEAEAAIAARGGKATSSVSAHTDYLVVGDNPGSSKLSQAEQNSVTQLDEDGFLGLVGS